jgi:hypothetical protein
MKDGYTHNVPDILVAAVGTDAALLGSRLVAFADEQGIARVSQRWLCDTFGWTGNTFRKHAHKLDVLRIWHMQTSVGRGHLTEWKKGSNFDTFMSDKRFKNCALKGSNFEPNNKNNNKNINISACAPARERGAAQRGREREAARLYYAGDVSLRPQDIDRMQMLRYNGKIAYCEQEDLQQCLACGATIFQPIR